MCPLYVTHPTAKDSGRLLDLTALSDQPPGTGRIFIMIFILNAGQEIFLSAGNLNNVGKTVVIMLLFGFLIKYKCCIHSEMGLTESSLTP